MTAAHLEQERKKALQISFAIYVILIILFIFIKWSNQPPAVPVVADQIEIDLGNDNEGFGEEQPLVKGSPTPEKTEPAQNDDPVSAQQNDPDSDPNADDDAAAVNKKNDSKKQQSQSTVSVKKDKKGKLLFTGNNRGPNGNNPNEDNGFKSQGNNPDGSGDIGSPNGKPRTVAIDRSLLKNYQFADELGNEKVIAIILVNTNGKGRFLKFAKGSSTTNKKYQNAIETCLPKISFTPDNREYETPVTFDFRVN